MLTVRHLICHRILLPWVSGMRGWRSVSKEGSEVVISGLVELLAWRLATGIFTQLPSPDSSINGIATKGNS